MNKKLILGVVGLFCVGAGVFATTNMLNNKKVNEVVIPYRFDFASTDAQKNSDGWTTSIIRQVNATLTSVDNHDKVQNWNASKIDISKNGLDYKIRLNDDFSWQDGKKVTSKDYYYGLKHLLTNKTKSDYASWALDYIKGSNAFYANKTNEISGFKIKDDHNFEISLSKKCKYFTYLLSTSVFSPLREDYVSKLGEKYGTDWNSILSSGLYKINRTVPGSFVELVQNNKSKKAKSLDVKKIKFKRVETKENEFKLYNQGKLTNFVETKNLGKINGNNTVINHSEMHYLVPNNATNSSSLNKAFYLALDKNYISNSLLNGFGKTTGTIYPTSLNHGAKFENQNLFDLKKAKEYLKDAKLKTNKINLLVTNSMNEEVLKYIINQEKKIGLDVNVRYTTPLAIDKEMFKPANSSRNYDFAINVWNENYADIHAFTSEFINPYFSYINKFDNEIAKHVSNADNEMNKYFNEKGLLFTLWQAKTKLYYKDNIKSLTPTGYFLNGWYWTK